MEQINADWLPFEGGNTIRTKGSEEGIIIIDIEHTEGARITVEKDSRIAPFAITMGIYGLMFHTHFEGTKEASEKYVGVSQNRINKILAMYETSNEKRDESWRTELDCRLKELVDHPTITSTSDKE